MPITHDEISSAGLAHLDLHPDEQKHISNDLAQFNAHVDRCRAVAGKDQATVDDLSRPGAPKAIGR